MVRNHTAVLHKRPRFSAGIFSATMYAGLVLLANERPPPIPLDMKNYGPKIDSDPN